VLAARVEIAATEPRERLAEWRWDRDGVRVCDAGRGCARGDEGWWPALGVRTGGVAAVVVVVAAGGAVTAVVVVGTDGTSVAPMFAGGPALQSCWPQRPPDPVDPCPPEPAGGWPLPRGPPDGEVG
jgi:hypothetical protein